MKHRVVITLCLGLVGMLLSARAARAQVSETPPSSDSRLPIATSPEGAPPPTDAPVPADAPDPVPGDEAPLVPAVPASGDDSEDEGDASEPASPPTPARLSTWILDGDLIEDEEVVRSFLRPIMQDSQNWSPDEQDSLQQFLLDFGYHSTIVNEALPGGFVRATLTLRPVTLVRYVEVDVGASQFFSYERWEEFKERFKQPLFSDEIRRRMTIRPGTTLAPDEATRTEQLQAEAERLRTYLINDGFYEAQVSVAEKAVDGFESHVIVTVEPGPPYFIGEIEVVGNLAIETKDVEALFLHDRLCIIASVCVGTRRFSRPQLLKDVQEVVKLYQRRGYPGVRVRTDFDPRHSFRRSDRRVNFRVDVRERRQIDVVFEGNSENHPAEKLSEHLTLSEVASYDDVEVQASARAIRNYYQSEGYFETQVTWDREVFPDFNFERILFYIDEGPRLRVQRVAFAGNRALSSGTLRAQLRTRVYKKYGLGDQGGYATTQQLDEDIKRIVARYQDEGYRDTTVRLEVSRSKELEGSAPALAASVAGRGQADGLFVTFHIDEGQRSIVSEVVLSFEGAHQMTEDAIRERFKLEAGDGFLEEVARNDGKELQRFYFARGYPRARVTTTFDSTPEGVTVAHSVIENSQARIGKIAIRGNFKTRDWVILDELGLHEGDLLTVKAAEQAQTKLRQSGLFATVQVSYVGRENPRQEVVNVLVRVEERHDNWFSYEVGGGYSTDSEAFTEANAGVQNLGGIGARLDLRVLWGQQQRFSEIKFRLPTWVMSRFVGTELSLETGINYREDETERFGELTTIGGSIALNKDWQRGLFEGWLLSLRYDYRLRNRDVFLLRPSGNSDDIEQTKVTTISSAVGPRLIRDRRRDKAGNRNPLTPNQGYKVEFRALFAEDYLLGSDRFLKLGAAGQKFWPISDRLTLSSGVRYDHGVPLGGVSLLPEIERFFAGGDSTVRGYEEDHLAVEVIENPLSPIGSITQFRVVPAGGNIRFLHNIDLQLNVWDDPWFDFPIASALFLDTGLITNSHRGLEFSDFGFGAGVALIRWVLPVGSLSIQYAVPLTVKTGDNPRGRFHVNLGVLFN